MPETNKRLEVRNPNPDESWKAHDRAWFYHDGFNRVAQGVVTFTYEPDTPGRHTANVFVVNTQVDRYRTVPFENLFRDEAAARDALQAAIDARATEYFHQMPDAEAMIRDVLRRYLDQIQCSPDDKAFVAAVSRRAEELFGDANGVAPARFEKALDTFTKDADGNPTQDRFVRLDEPSLDVRVGVVFPADGPGPRASLYPAPDQKSWEPFGAPEFVMQTDDDTGHPLFATALVPSTRTCATRSDAWARYVARVNRNLRAVEEVIASLKRGETYRDA